MVCLPILFPKNYGKLQVREAKVEPPRARLSEFYQRLVDVLRDGPGYGSGEPLVVEGPEQQTVWVLVTSIVGSLHSWTRNIFATVPALFGENGFALECHPEEFRIWHDNPHALDILQLLLEHASYHVQRPADDTPYLVVTHP